MANKRPKPEEIVTKLRQVEVVPGGGIEPPTRGFSIHCSTPELPGHGRWWNTIKVGAF